MSQTRLHALMIRSIIGEVLSNGTMMAMRRTATIVARTPATIVMIVRGMSIKSRID
jgi:hypothetical protein